MFFIFPQNIFKNTIDIFTRFRSTAQASQAVTWLFLLMILFPFTLLLMCVHLRRQGGKNQQNFTTVQCVFVKCHLMRVSRVNIEWERCKEIFIAQLILIVRCKRDHHWGKLTGERDSCVLKNRKIIENEPASNNKQFSRQSSLLRSVLAASEGKSTVKIIKIIKNNNLEEIWSFPQLIQWHARKAPCLGWDDVATRLETR